MNAFQTYWMRYAVNLKTREVEELPDRDGDVCIDMDSYVQKCSPRWWDYR